ncbi:MAG: hypothetical protein MRY32_06215 [Rickettsiales bacterium]|nr:hypothetical protein [Rickettsiales bacterium]
MPTFSADEQYERISIEQLKKQMMYRITGLVMVSICLSACSIGRSPSDFERALNQEVERESYKTFGYPRVKIQDFSSGDLNQRVR